jgi:hypothetical protein
MSLRQSRLLTAFHREPAGQSGHSGMFRCFLDCLSAECFRVELTSSRRSAGLPAFMHSFRGSILFLLIRLTSGRRTFSRL